MTGSANGAGCNFLLITSDQHNPFICGYAGSPVTTPALDQMAASGITFTAAYTNDPVCMPARATLASGRYGSATANYDNGTPYAGDEAESWGHRLSAQGRAAVTFGKLHFAPEGDSGYQTHLPLQASRGYGAALMGWARGNAPVNDMMVRHALDARAGRAEYADYDRHTTRSACRLMKNVMYDASARVPFVMTGPGVDAGTVCSAPVSLADVFPTVLAVTGTQSAAADADLPGASLLKLAGSAPDERAVFSEYHGPSSTAASYMVRKGRHNLVTHMHPDAANQLFDMVADAFELADLIDDPAMDAVVADLNDELRTIVDPEALDAEIRATQVAELERVGGADRLRPPPVSPRAAYGTIALDWSIPPPEIMAEVADAS